MRFGAAVVTFVGQGRRWQSPAHREGAKVQNGEQGRWPWSPTILRSQRPGQVHCYGRRRRRRRCRVCREKYVFIVRPAERATSAASKSIRLSRRSFRGVCSARRGRRSRYQSHVFIIHAKSLSINPPAAADAALSLPLENCPLCPVVETGFPLHLCVCVSASDFLAWVARRRKVVASKRRRQNANETIYLKLLRRLSDNEDVCGK